MIRMEDIKSRSGKPERRRFVMLMNAIRTYYRYVASCVWMLKPGNPP